MRLKLLCRLDWSLISKKGGMIAKIGLVSTSDGKLWDLLRVFQGAKTEEP